MKKSITYIILSSILPLIFFINVLVPVTVLGCYTRGLIAAVIALLSALLALFAVIKGAMIKLKSIEDSKIWILSSIILAVPAIYIVIIAY